MDRDLDELAERLLAEARRQLDTTGQVLPAIVLRYADGSFDKATLSEDQARIMNSGAGKEALFGFVRAFAKAKQCTAVLLVTDCWMGEPTDRGKRMAKEEPERYEKEVLQGVAHACELGLARRVEAVVVTVQTPESTGAISQFYERFEHVRRIAFGKRLRTEGPQSDFSGRQKMFGDLREENLH